MKSYKFLIFSLLLTLTLPSTPARALTPAEQRELHDTITQANAHWEAKRFEQALPLYQLAYKKSAHPDLLYRIAQIHERRAHYALAITAYSDYLKLAPQNPYAQRIASHILALEEKKKDAQPTLSIRTSPPGASVFLDGWKLDDLSPMSTTLDEGTYLLEVKLEGYEPRSEELSLKNGDNASRTFKLAEEAQQELPMPMDEPALSEPEPELVARQEPEPRPEAEPEVSARRALTVVDIRPPVWARIISWTCVVVGTPLVMAGGVFTWRRQRVGTRLLLSGAGVVGVGGFFFWRDWSRGLPEAAAPLDPMWAPKSAPGPGVQLRF